MKFDFNKGRTPSVVDSSFFLCTLFSVLYVTCFCRSYFASNCSHSPLTALRKALATRQARVAVAPPGS